MCSYAPDQGAREAKKACLLALAKRSAAKREAAAAAAAEERTRAPAKRRRLRKAAIMAAAATTEGPADTQASRDQHASSPHALHGRLMRCRNLRMPHA